ncbi:MAG: Hsp20/alpha crystallin family protein [Fuerstiella sp.]
MNGSMKKRESTTPGQWFQRGPLASLREEMDDLFQNFFGTSAPATLADVTVPSIDVAETEDAVEVKTDVPGMKVDDISIEIRNDHLVISGETSEEKKEDDAARKYHRVERRTGSFSRAIRLPCSVQEEKVDAELKDGVLTVVLPKAEEAKSRKIPIKG